MLHRDPPQKGAFIARSTDAQVERTEKSRTVRFVASTEAVDRYGDIIRVSGWQLDNYKRNNVLLFGHQSRALPIGTADVWVDHDRKALLADATFWSRDVNEFADDVFKMVEAGGLRATSVGFLPTEAPNYLYDTPNPGPDDWPTGFEFIAQDLLELSVVSVPANPEALALARSLVCEATIARLFDCDARALAHVQHDHLRRSISIARQRGR